MGNGGATLKKRDLIVTLLYFLDMAVLILSVMFSIWMRNEFRVEALAKEITRGSFWLSMVVLAVIYACVFTLSRREQIRVSKKAVKNGVTFSDYGSSLIRCV